MANYNYKIGKTRVEEILNNDLNIIVQNKLPSIENLTFTNGYKSWVSAVFVDIRNSTSLFSEGNKEKVSKIIRSFTSEIIEILRVDDKLREIGIRGDCVYAIYTAPLQLDIFEALERAAYINTYLKMLNKLLSEKKYPTISAGIGIGADEDLIVKAGRKDVGINNAVWIGDAVTSASNLSAKGNKGIYDSIVISSSVYNNTIDILKANHPGKVVDNWFHKHYDAKLGTFYSTNLIISEFDEWIDNGMKE